MARNGYSLFDTPIGFCGIAWSERGLARVQLPERGPAATEGRLRRAADRATPPPAMQSAIAAIVRYCTGEEVGFADVDLDLADAEPFERAVYDVARTISWGRTMTYGAVARAIGKADAARDVGQALGRNPVPIVVPCHRVLASGNGVGGFSAPGGTFTKQRLLALEGVRLGGDYDFPRLPGL